MEIESPKSSPIQESVDYRDLPTKSSSDFKNTVKI